MAVEILFKDINDVKIFMWLIKGKWEVYQDWDNLQIYSEIQIYKTFEN